jgi:hypothetical protein
MDLKTILEDFQDYLAPKLDTYEQAIYLYIFRHSRLEGQATTVIGFKSARKDMAFGIGEKGKPMSEATCYDKLKSLEAKSCLRILGTEHKGTRVELRLPSEITGLIPVSKIAAELALEEIDFFTSPTNRALILQREGNRCFYCLRSIDPTNFVIDHVQERRNGGNGYRNVVAACRSCNNKKNKRSAEDHLRNLYRDGLLAEEEFGLRLQQLTKLQEGALKPPVATQRVA